MKEYEEAVASMRPELHMHALILTRGNEAEATSLTKDTIAIALSNADRYAAHGHLRSWMFSIANKLFIYKVRLGIKKKKVGGENGNSIASGMRRLAHGIGLWFRLAHKQLGTR